jgi:hypothetical protein
MTELAEVLQQLGIDTTTLTLFCTTPEGPVYSLPVMGDKAVSYWRSLRQLVDSTGLWPVISRSRESLGYSTNDIEALIEELQSGAASRIIMAASFIDPVAWLKQRWSALVDDDEEEDPASFREAIQGTRPGEGTPITAFSIPSSAVVELNLIPTTVPWRVPAYFRYGGGGGLEPAEHVAILRRWNALYGAEIVGINGDTIEMQVSRPPRDREVALDLAWEQFCYCWDIVIQGVRTVENLAATLLNSPVWYFWWD